MKPMHDRNDETAATQTPQERKLEVLLEERLGRATTPDLSASILAAAKGESIKPAPVHSIQQARSNRLRKAMGIGAAAASVVIGVGLMLADQWIGSSDSTNPDANTGSALVGDDSAPPTKQPSSNALAAPSTYNNVLLIEDMTHPQDIGEHTIHMVMGRVLVSPSGMPDKAMLASTTQTYQLNDKEIVQMKNQNNWIVRSGVAMCVLSGGLIFNGEALLAQDAGSTHTEVELDSSFVEHLTKSSKTKTTPFEDIDKNGDGFLDKEEYPVLTRDKTIDGDKDGKASKVEYQKFNERLQRSTYSPGKTFEDIDENSDGYLDKSEYPALTRSTTIDTDKDEKISKAEYVAHMKEMEKALAEITKIFEDMEAVEASKIFEEIDTNKDGELDGDEYDIEELKKKDANTDGVVSREEWDEAKVDVLRLRTVKDGEVTRVEPSEREEKLGNANKQLKSLKEQTEKLRAEKERLKDVRKTVQPRSLKSKKLEKPMGDK